MHPPVLVLAHAIDFAGLFPPAALSMRTAVEDFARHARSADAWALGRFVVPADRLQELLAALALVADVPDPLELAVVLGADPGQSGREIEACGDRVRIGALEGKAEAPEAVARVAARWRPGPEIYIEPPLNLDPSRFVAALAAAGVGAKLRTGGITEAGFPEPPVLLGWLQALTRANVPYKCTAGLHHPVRGRYRLTYEPDSSLGTMYGYLNLLVAGAGLQDGWPEHEVMQALVEDNPSAFRVRGSRLGWRDRELNPGAIEAFRTRGMRGFGSCSFREPLDELAEVPVA